MGKYRLVTRSDFDGLVCAVLLRELDLIGDIKFVHPKDMQDGIIDITENEKTILDGLLNLKEIKGKGKVVIRNPSNKSRLWNLTCDLKEIVNTTIDSREINVGILNPSQEFNNDYALDGSWPT